MNSTETIAETLFSEAVSAMRGGRIEDGMQLMDSIEGEEIMKNLVKAEVAYWRGEWKDAMFFDEHSLSSDHLWTNQLVVVFHLRAYVMAARKIGAESRAKCFLEYYIDIKRKQLGSAGARPYAKIFQNAMRRLDGEPAKDEPKPAKLIEGDESSCKIQMFSMNGPITPGKESAIPISMILEVSQNHVPTKAIISLYEQYADYIVADNPHLMAARNYILLGESEKTIAALMRVMSIWEPPEKFQVMPMKYFVYSDLAEFIYDSGINLQMLATPRAVPYAQDKDQFSDTTIIS